MSKVVLSPYPRLKTTSVEWSSWTATIDGREISLDQIADQVDVQSILSFSTSVSVPVSELDLFDFLWSRTELVLTISSNATAFTVSKSKFLVRTEATCHATVSVTVPAKLIAENLVLRAQLVSCASNTPWLSRLIIADAPLERLPLHSEQVGFPTVSYSFEQEGLPDTPWRLVVDADEADASFMHSVRLELNEDFPLVCEYLDGKSVPLISSQVTALIVRVLVGTVARLSSDNGEGRSPDDIASVAPDSIAASAARATQLYLGRSLNWAVEKYKTRPEVFEMALAAGTNIAIGR